MMKRLLLLVVWGWLVSVQAFAQGRVVDSEDQSPIVAASVFDVSGNMIGLTGSDGSLPDVSSDIYPLTVRCIGYELLTIKEPAEIIPLKQRPYELEEVVVLPGEREVVRLKCYMREFVSFVYEEDTLSHYNEYMVDYLLPRNKKTKFSGVYRPRVLNKRSYERISNAKKDSVVTEDESVDLSLIDILDLNKEEVVVPASFKQMTGRIKTDSVVAKYGVEKVYRQTPYSFTIFEDELANKKNHKWTPFIFKMFGFTIDLFEMREATAFIPNEEGVYKYEDMISNTVGYDMNIRGKTFKKMVKSNKPLRAKTLFEQYVTSREYLTVEEAEAIQNEKIKNEPIVVPSSASPLDAATLRLIEQTDARKKKK